MYYCTFRQNSRQKNKLASNIKLNLLGEKIKWFQDHLDLSLDIYTPYETHKLIEKYLGRFDKELEQIKLKHSIGNRKNRQHASREDIIKMTIKRDLEEFNSCGIGNFTLYEIVHNYCLYFLEIPDIMDNIQFKLLKDWNGELRFIQNFKLKRFNKQLNIDEESMFTSCKQSMDNLD